MYLKSEPVTLAHPLLQFAHPHLLEQALTHRSYVREHPHGAIDNERLEYLGDALLTFLCGDYLYHRFPKIKEDEMTRRRAALVDETQLAEFALEIGLDQKMRLGRGIAQDGGTQNRNLLSSTFEAVVGAFYLDCDRNIEKVRPVIESLFDQVPEQVMTSRSTLDSKNRLQEWTHAHVGHTPPQYVTEKIGGTDHNPEFAAQVYVGGKLIGRGQGRSKKEAEKQAAEHALSNLLRRGLL
jgi:ribonuclease-3